MAHDINMLSKWFIVYQHRGEAYTICTKFTSYPSIQAGQSYVTRDIWGSGDIFFHRGTMDEILRPWIDLGGSDSKFICWTDVKVFDRLGEWRPFIPLRFRDPIEPGTRYYGLNGWMVRPDVIISALSECVHPRTPRGGDAIITMKDHLITSALTPTMVNDPPGVHPDRRTKRQCAQIIMYRIDHGQSMIDDQSTFRDRWDRIVRGGDLERYTVDGLIKDFDYYTINALCAAGRWG